MVKILGALLDSNEKQLRRLHPLVDCINRLEAEFEALADADLGRKTDELRNRLANGESLDELLPQAFAAAREAAKRTLGQRHFDVQLMGGVVLHQGKIAEMKTGEGKTLVATLPMYLNALAGKGGHVVTVNDYLAKRDCNWMGPIYHMLGLKAACIQHEASFLFDGDYDSGDPAWKHLKPVKRREAYEADITYGTNNEFGFDYLRDNMVDNLSQCVQRPLHYAIVDEVDNILIDEARTPLIISGAATEATNWYKVFARLVPRLRSGEDYELDEKDKVVTRTEEGTSRVEMMLRQEGLLRTPSLYDPPSDSLLYYLDSALKADVLFSRDRDYVVKNGEVIIVDEFTGRLMHGRRYSEGLHQAIEAKEGVQVQRENVTLATITFQNYFRMYDKLAGMTGTAVTEAEEFYKIYKLEVVVIPTNKPMIRTNHPDQIYSNEEAKFRAVVREIEGLHAEGHPVLVGTASIKNSEKLSELLKRKGIPHQVLNATNPVTLDMASIDKSEELHEREAKIIAQAGQPGTVTVATNMAGRGVDIILGGKLPDYEPYQDVNKFLKEIIDFRDQGVDLLEEQNVFKGLKDDLQENRKYIVNDINFQVKIIKQKNRDHQEALDEQNDERLSEIKREIDQQEQMLKVSLEEYQSLVESQAVEIEEKLRGYLSKAENPSIIGGIKSLINAKEKAKHGKLNITEVLFEARKRFLDWLDRYKRVKDLGGLHVIGTERHEARRIDNQLRGRAGRQGNPGSSRFYVSLEDDVVRRFGGDRIKAILERINFDEDTPIEHNMVGKAIETAQVKIEGYHFDMRKHLVDYDDVVNKHREVIYSERRRILSGADIKSNIQSMVKKEIEGLVASYLRGDTRDGWNLEGLLKDLGTMMSLPKEMTVDALRGMTRDEMERRLVEYADSLYAEREREFGDTDVRILERLVMLRTIDHLWMEHLTAMEEMRRGIGFEAMGQRDPLVIYKRRGHEMFDSLLAAIGNDVARTIFRVSITRGKPPQSPMAEAAKRKEAVAVGGKKVGRNAPCPCGSGKKYKHCCGK